MKKNITTTVLAILSTLATSVQADSSEAEQQRIHQINQQSMVILKSYIGQNIQSVTGQFPFIFTVEQKADGGELHHIQRKRKVPKPCNIAETHCDLRNFRSSYSCRMFFETDKKGIVNNFFISGDRDLCLPQLRKRSHTAS